MGKPIEGVPNKCEGPDKAPQETVASPGSEGQGERQQRSGEVPGKRKS